MPNAYNGQADLPSRPAFTSIASSTFATPIVVTTSTPHLLTEGDEILISGHLVNTNANGVWYAHIISSTQVQLLVPVTRANSVGNGVGAATGICQSQNLSPTYNEPSDGDAGSAASVNVALSALGDRTAWLAQRVGSYKQISFIASGAVGAFDPPVTVQTWNSNTYGTPYNPLTLTTDLAPGDIVVAKGFVTVQWVNPDTITVKVQRSIGGGAVSDFTGQTSIFLSTAATLANAYASCSFQTIETISTTTSLGSWALNLVAKSSGSNNTSVLSNSSFEIAAYRAN